MSTKTRTLAATAAADGSLSSKKVEGVDTQKIETPTPNSGPPPTRQQEFFLYTPELHQAVTSYMSTQPYNQVFGLVETLKRVPKTTLTMIDDKKGNTGA
jgi:hypothetical protein